MSYFVKQNTLNRPNFLQKLWIVNLQVVPLLVHFGLTQRRIICLPSEFHLFKHALLEKFAREIKGIQEIILEC